MRSSKTPIRTVACVVGLGLMFVQAAFAAETQPIRFNAADQTAAKAVMLKAADLGAGWKGGATKPDLTPDDACAMKRSDLVLTGAARSEFTAPGAMVSSESNVLQSPGMVATEWRRSTGNAAYMACIRKEYLTADEPNVKVISFKPAAFPKLTQYSVRYRMIADFGKPGSSTRLVVDMILLGQGRTEVMLTVWAPYADRATTDRAERRLAQIVVGRIRA
ncbi:MAG: hypothetical protein QOF45_1163 [Gaiellaceae bacterium]|nr:hypothetical protein [Gaiellaceae bacterium]